MEGKLFVVSDKMMIDDYITKHDLSMSMFLEVVDKADMRGTIHAYGRYTCFIPDNDAMNRHLQSQGKSSVNDMTHEECLNMVKYHIVRLDPQRDSVLTTSRFVDGRLPVPTMLSKYLTTRGERAENGAFVIRVNRQADIIREDIMLANGCIHKIDNVLIPPEATCGDRVRDLPDEEYSLFKQVMEETGWTQRLTEDKTDTSWYTVFVQSNAAFASVGIYDIDSLMGYLEGKGVLLDTALIYNMPSTVDMSDKKAVLLWAFAAYHCVNDLYYVVDLMNANSLLTCAPNQVMTFKVKRDSLLINEYINLGKYERGIPIDKESDYTDWSCYNGVLVDVGGYVGPERRGPQAVFWEITDQPEFRKNPKYRKQWFNITKDEVEALSEMKVTFASGITFDNATKTDDNVGTFYYSYRPGWDSRTHFSFSDALGIKMADVARIDLTMPVLTPGTYTVWVAWRRADVNACRARATFIENGVESEMGSVSFHESFDTGKDALVLLAQGMKRYNAKVRSTVLNCRRWGAMTVKTTGQHTLRIDVIERGRSTAMWIDMIHFIPNEDDQLWPRFDYQGNPIYKGTPCEDIEPKNQPGICPADNDAK
jgi:uncharacterized surface protein with fasciclin (FAS1) repeats